jgi:hypothetical protein
MPEGSTITGPNILNKSLPPGVSLERSMEGLSNNNNRFEQWPFLTPEDEFEGQMLNVDKTFWKRSQNVLKTFTQRSENVHNVLKTFTQRSENVHNMHVLKTFTQHSENGTKCSENVHRTFWKRSQNDLKTFTEHSENAHKMIWKRM